MFCTCHVLTDGPSSLNYSSHFSKELHKRSVCKPHRDRLLKRSKVITMFTNNRNNNLSLPIFRERLCNLLMSGRLRLSRNELRSSRPKVMLPEVMLPETRVMLPEILCHVARNLRKKILKNANGLKTKSE